MDKSSTRDYLSCVPGNPKFRAFEARMDELGLEFLLDRIEAGETLSAVARELNVKPHFLYKWMRRDPERQKAYQRARELGAAPMADQAVDILDNADVSSSERLRRDEMRSKIRMQYAGLADRKNFGPPQLRTGTHITLNVGELHLEALKAKGSPRALPNATVALPAEEAEYTIEEDDHGE